MSDAVVDALRTAGVPGRAWEPGDADQLRKDVAYHLDAIGLVAAAHASPTARAAMLRVLLAERLEAMANDDGDVEIILPQPRGRRDVLVVVKRDVAGFIRSLSLLAPEGPPESAGASRKADTE